MSDDKLEKMLERLLKQDYSVGTEAFRDALLSRCLEELNEAESDNGEEHDVVVLSDDELELLSAAGDIFSEQRGRPR